MRSTRNDKRLQDSSRSLFHYKMITCPTCFGVLPWNVLVEGRVFNLVEIARPKKDYLIIEKTEINLRERCLYMMKANEKKEVVIGRGKGCDILVRDFTCSTVHCRLKYI